MKVTDDAAGRHETGRRTSMNGANSRDVEIGRLRAEVERLTVRQEEVTAYYRGELEGARRRFDDEIVRVQAAEIGRRKSAEARGAALAEENGALRATLDQTKSAAETRVPTGDEDRTRLERDLAELRSQLERERDERRQQRHDDDERRERQRLTEGHRSRLFERMKGALKVSEARRQALEEQLAGVRAGQASFDGDGYTGSRDFARRPVFGHATIEVDPEAGWGTVQLADGDDFNPAFLEAASDRSLEAAPSAVELAEEQDSEAESVSDQEAEALVINVAVERQIAYRQASKFPERTPQPRRRRTAPIKRSRVRSSHRGAVVAIALLIATGAVIAAFFGVVDL